MRDQQVRTDEDNVSLLRGFLASCALFRLFLFFSLCLLHCWLYQLSDCAAGLPSNLRRFGGLLGGIGLLLSLGLESRILCLRLCLNLCGWPLLLLC